MTEELMIAAVIGAARGLRGEIGLDVRTDRPEEVFEPGSVLTTDSKDFPRLTVESWSTHQGRFLAFFAEVTSREEADALRGTTLLIEPSEEDDAWYPEELRGLAAVTPDGQRLGTVKTLRFGAAQDLLVVEHEGRDVLVPFVEELVPQVLPAEGKVVIDAPTGLFDIENLS